MQGTSRTAKSEDFESGALRDGYPALATWIAQDPDNESLVFRKFDRLSARNLLHLQSQIIELEARLEKYDRETTQSRDLDLRLSARRWETLVTNAKDKGKAEEKKRLELYEEIQVKLKQYRKESLISIIEYICKWKVFLQADNATDEALLLQAQIAQLGRPSNRVYTTLRNWFDGTAGARGPRSANPILSGEARNMLENRQDLVALRPPADKDILSSFLQDHWPFQV